MTEETLIAATDTLPRLLVLVGFMGAGKSSAGRELASLLGRRFLDLDEMIVRRERRSVASIFAISGEAYFRRQESRQLEQLARKMRSAQAEALVLAVGGGAWASPANRRTLQLARAAVIHLAAPAEVLRQRIGGGSGRPLAADPQKFLKLYEERLALYQMAGLTVDTTNLPVAQVARQIVERLRQAGEVPSAAKERMEL
jgi:shikimate kinase